MMNEKQRTARQRRKAPTSALHAARRVLMQSHQLAAAGQFTKAARAATLAERHAKLAAQLIDLDASLKRIADARHRALTAIAAAAAKRAQANITISSDTDYADPNRNWSITDPRVKALFNTAMEQGS